MTEKTNDNPDSALVEVLTQLNAATLAVVKQLRLPEARDVVEAYWTPIISNCADDSRLSAALETRITDIKNLSDDHVKSKRGTFYDTGLEEMGLRSRLSLTGGSAVKTAKNEKVWERLRAPLDAGDVELIKQRIDETTKAGTAVPVVVAAALARRLDEVLSPESWDVRIDPLENGSVRCRLVILGATRETVARGDDFNVTIADAVRAAARLFGMAKGLHGEQVVSINVSEDGVITNVDEILDTLIEEGVVNPLQ